MKKTIILLFCLAFVFSVSGQDGATLIECTSAEYESIAALLNADGFLSPQYDSLVTSFSLLPDNVSQTPNLIILADHLQSTWWATKTPQMARCAFSSQLVNSMGRALDEILISASLTQLARPEPKSHQYARLAENHRAAAQVAIAEIITLLDFLNARIQPTVVQPTSTMPSVTFTEYSQPRTYYISGNNVNIRSASTTQASIVTVLSRGTAIRVIGEESGTSVNGSALWYVLDIGGQTGYAHSSLVSTSAPATAAPRPTSIPNSVPNNNTNNNNTSSEPQPTQPPAPAPQSPPTEPPVSQPSDAQICGGATTCGQMASCDQAYACLRAGDSDLDRDKDGVPCESICPGG